MERGRAKLERKGLDAVVVNDISRSDIGFDSDRQRGHDRATAAGERDVAAGGPRRRSPRAILDEVERLQSTGVVGRYRRSTSNER